jgi:hypothetical protein
LLVRLGPTSQFTTAHTTDAIEIPGTEILGKIFNAFGAALHTTPFDRVNGDI